MTLAVTTFLAILALLAALGVVAVAVLAAVGRLSVVREHIGPAALWLALAVQPSMCSASPARGPVSS